MVAFLHCVSFWELWLLGRNWELGALLAHLQYKCFTHLLHHCFSPSSSLISPSSLHSSLPLPRSPCVIIVILIFMEKIILDPSYCSLLSSASQPASPSSPPRSSSPPGYYQRWAASRSHWKKTCMLGASAYETPVTSAV